MGILGILVLALGGCATIDASESAPGEMTVVVLPHPDDEFQVWSQIEQQDDAYTVLLLMTRGEESGYCDTDVGGGRWTDRCSEARIDSWLSFMTAMGEADATLPSDLPDEPTSVDVPVEDGVTPARDDDGTIVPSAGASAWVDAQGRGALVAFDLGDGDLTQEEVSWAVSSVLDDRAAFGLDTDRSVGRVIGAYSYFGSVEGCFPYPHPDHAAVAHALTVTDLGAREQLYATCGLDHNTGATFVSTVSSTASEAAFGGDGAFPDAYGWLGPWPLADDQSELFHRAQAFRVR